jgi:hypothetical protein
MTSAPSVTDLTFTVLAQEQVNKGPQGPEFGKASPVGLLVIVALLVAILAIGYLFNRRMKTMLRRRQFAEKHGIDPFDIAEIDRRMAADQNLTDDEVSDQAWPTAEPEEFANRYGDGADHTDRDAGGETDSEADGR